MASIIQVLIHLEKFLNVFLKVKYDNKKPLSCLFYNFIKKIANSKVNAIEIRQFAEEYNKINYKFNGEEGNNPMTFFNEFIAILGNENNENILNLFMGKKQIKFIGVPELDYQEDFIFHLIALDENIKYLQDALYNEKEIEDNENIKLKEEIIIKPEILVINIEIDDIDYNFEVNIMIDNNKYLLKAINRYNNFHSTV